MSAGASGQSSAAWPDLAKAAYWVHQKAVRRALLWALRRVAAPGAQSVAEMAVTTVARSVC
jgi:hypothetical protein